jgi:hypothetical protein
MALAKKLGQNYEAIRAAARFKTIKIKLNDLEFDLKVRIPVKRELEEMTTAIASPPKEYVEKLYEDLSRPLLESLKDAGDGFLDVLNQDGDKIKMLDNDILVDGTSIRQVAQMSGVWHKQVERYFSLLQSETGEPVNETFEEISEEFPEQVIREIVEKIEQAIRPNYKDTKKN